MLVSWEGLQMSQEIPEISTHLLESWAERAAPVDALELLVKSHPKASSILMRVATAEPEVSESECGGLLRAAASLMATQPWCDPNPGHPSPPVSTCPFSTSIIQSILSLVFLCHSHGSNAWWSPILHQEKKKKAHSSDQTTGSRRNLITPFYCSLYFLLQLPSTYGMLHCFSVTRMTESFLFQSNEKAGKGSWFEKT